MLVEPAKDPWLPSTSYMHGLDGFTVDVHSPCYEILYLHQYPCCMGAIYLYCAMSCVYTLKMATHVQDPRTKQFKRS